MTDKRCKVANEIVSGIKVLTSSRLYSPPCRLLLKKTSLPCFASPVAFRCQNNRIGIPVCCVSAHRRCVPALVQPHAGHQAVCVGGAVQAAHQRPPRCGAQGNRQSHPSARPPHDELVRCCRSDPCHRLWALHRAGVQPDARCSLPRTRPLQPHQTPAGLVPGAARPTRGCRGADAAAAANACAGPHVLPRNASVSSTLDSS